MRSVRRPNGALCGLLMTLGLAPGIASDLPVGEQTSQHALSEPLQCQPRNEERPPPNSLVIVAQPLQVLVRILDGEIRLENHLGAV